MIAKQFREAEARAQAVLVHASSAPAGSLAASTCFVDSHPLPPLQLPDAPPVPPPQPVAKPGGKGHSSRRGPEEKKVKKLSLFARWFRGGSTSANAVHA